jgi:hypothetical protein
MSTSEHDLVFHLLDLQARDIRIENEEDDVKECVYESNSVMMNLPNIVIKRQQSHIIKNESL